jgi:predicted GTPase
MMEDTTLEWNHLYSDLVHDKHSTSSEKMEKMTGMRKQKQLIMFMTGPGGSGKMKVINAVMAYAKGYCKELNYMLDKRMIVVTALTGVAATLINGETMHSAAKLNYKNITSEHIDEWHKAHLLIIDEISFF